MTELTDKINAYRDVMERLANIKDVVGYGSGILRAAEIVLETLQELKPQEPETHTIIQEILARLTEAERANRSTVPDE